MDFSSVPYNTGRRDNIMYFLQHSVITRVWYLNPDWICIQMGLCVRIWNPYSKITFKMTEITQGETVF
jgi:hypothetical protein